MIGACGLLAMLSNLVLCTLKTISTTGLGFQTPNPSSSRALIAACGLLDALVRTAFGRLHWRTAASICAADLWSGGGCSPRRQRDAGGIATHSGSRRTGRIEQWADLHSLQEHSSD